MNLRERFAAWRTALWRRIPVQVRSLLCRHVSVAVDKVQPLARMTNSILVTSHCRRCGRVWLSITPTAVLQARERRELRKAVN